MQLRERGSYNDAKVGSWGRGGCPTKMANYAAETEGRLQGYQTRQLGQRGSYKDVTLGSRGRGSYKDDKLGS